MDLQLGPVLGFWIILMGSTLRMQQLLVLALAAVKWTEKYSWETIQQQDLNFWDLAASFQTTPSHPVSGILNSLLELSQNFLLFPDFTSST